jgi:hypothetical protein
MGVVVRGPAERSAPRRASNLRRLRMRGMV